jgi:hypothetical protein
MKVAIGSAVIRVLLVNVVAPLAATEVTLREDHCRVRHKPCVWGRLSSMTLNCLRAERARNIAVTLHRNAMNFDRVRDFAFATRKT